MYYPTNDEFVIIEWHKISREDSQKVREVVKSKFYHGMKEKKIAVQKGKLMNNVKETTRRLERKSRDKMISDYKQIFKNKNNRP